MQNLPADATIFCPGEHFRSEHEHMPGTQFISRPAAISRSSRWSGCRAVDTGHDHGSWGVGRIVRGVLEERSYMSASAKSLPTTISASNAAAFILLNQGSVSSFVPNPDHIHMSGVPEERETCVSLHLIWSHMVHSTFTTRRPVRGAWSTYPITRAASCLDRTGRACPLCPGKSDVDLFRYGESVVDFDAKIAHGALNLRMPEYQLQPLSRFPGAAIDQGGLRSAQ